MGIRNHEKKVSHKRWASPPSFFFAQAIGTASAVWMKFYRKKHEAFVGAEDFELILRKRFPWRVKAPTDMPDMQSITYTNAFHEPQRVTASCAARRSSCECP
jgi:hypothetical protein